MGEGGFRAHCAACAAIEWCKHAFGKYWIDKSSGGVGCKSPLSSAKRSSAVNAAKAATVRQGVLL